MKPVDFRLAMWLCAAVFAAGAAGCEEKSLQMVQPASPQVSANPTPEEKLDYILETFRRGVEDPNIFFRVPRQGGHSMLAGQNAVKHELIKPNKEGQPYRAIITVVSQSHYSIQRSADRPDEVAREEEARSQHSESPLGESDPADGIAILDPDLKGHASSTGSNTRPDAVTSESTVARRKNQSDRKYELEYHDGRWTLITKLDPETEQGIQFAFDHALKTQI